MELVKDKWTQKDITEFQQYLKSLENLEKQEWTKNILNTNMPVLAIKSPVIKDIVNQIYKGNYLSFLDFMPWKYYENTAINGYLLSKITDFETVKKYLNVYSLKADNWATCDVLSFKIKGYEKEYFSLAKEYLKSDQTFVRRIALVILFNFVLYEDYLDELYELIDSLSNEKEYYVNMINAWLLCELFIKQKERTIKYLDKNNLNKFTINKAVQKCRDSFRVSKEDKDMLLKYKLK